MSIDLHLHSTFSDGTLEPKEIVKIAFNLKLKAIAITDHDTVDGIDEAKREAGRYPELVVIPGVELSTYWNGNEVHILGYYMDYKSLEFQRVLLEFQGNRQKRAIKILKKLNDLGISVSYREVKEKSAGKSLGRPHIAMALQERGYVTSIGEAFTKFLGEGSPAFVPRKKISPYYAIDLIKHYKGIPILAHPGLLQEQDIVKDVIEYGIMGIEAYHSKHTKEQTSHFKTLAKKHNLLVTGGSDSHGENPLLLGSLKIPDRVFLELKKTKACLSF